MFHTNNTIERGEAELQKEMNVKFKINRSLYIYISIIKRTPKTRKLAEII